MGDTSGWLVRTPTRGIGKWLLVGGDTNPGESGSELLVGGDTNPWGSGSGCWLVRSPTRAYPST